MMGGQQRVVAGGLGRPVVTGWDLGAGIEMARALGVNMLLAAEMLPVFEQIAVMKFNESEGAHNYD